jgi:hypothetical protein
MKKINLCFSLLMISAFAYGQESPTLSANSTYGNINIRANTSSVPVIRFTRWPGGAGSYQHNAFVGQFYNPGAGEYSFGIGTGLSTTGDQNFANTVVTVKNDGNVGIGTTAPRGPLEVRVTGNNNVVQTGLIIQQTNPNSPNNSAGVSLDFGIGNNDVNNNIVGKITLKETYWSARPKMIFSLWDENNSMKDRMIIDTYGNVGIGTTNPDAKLAVKGTVHAEEVKVDLQVPAPDYVFEENYHLPSLTETESYIKTHKHLPEIPSAREMEANGINLSEMNMLLLKKVEELTLHMIRQQAEIDQLEKTNMEFENRLKSVKQ